MKSIGLLEGPLIRNFQKQTCKMEQSNLLFGKFVIEKDNNLSFQISVLQHYSHCQTLLQTNKLFLLNGKYRVLAHEMSYH